MRWLLVALAVVAVGCSPQPESTTTAEATRGTESQIGDGRTVPAHGFSFSPPSYDGAGWAAFFPVAAEGGSIITWAGDWAELSGVEGPAFVIGSLAESAGVEMMAVVGPFSDGFAIRPVATSTDEYVLRALGWVEAHQPRFIVLGVEVDIASRRDPEEFEAFVELFAAAAEAVHDNSPETQVMVAFQLESMKGRRDGVFGGDIEAPTWDLIDRFPVPTSSPSPATRA